MRGRAKTRKSDISPLPMPRNPPAPGTEIPADTLSLDLVGPKSYALRRVAARFLLRESVACIMWPMLAIVILCIFPEIATWLPDHLMGAGK
jgi:hypothetical protein